MSGDKEFLEYDDFEELEPKDYYENHGLWLPKQKAQVREKNCIDRALKKLYGKHWKTPTGATRSDFRKK